MTMREYRFAILALAGLVGGIFLAASGETAVVNVKKAAQQRYGENLQKCERSASPLWAAELPGCRVYEVDVFNPRSRLAGRAILVYTAVLTPDRKLLFIETDPEAVGFLQAYAVPRRPDLKRLVELFVQVRRVKLITTWAAADRAAEKEIAAPVYDQAGEEQHAGFFVNFDPNITSVVRYDLYLSPAPALRVESRWISSRGGYD